MKPSSLHHEPRGLGRALGRPSAGGGANFGSQEVATAEDATAPWRGVPTPAVRAGQTAAPPQAESWSCGVVGAARALAIAGVPVTDLRAFIDGAPRLAIFGIAVGPPPRDLAAHARSSGGARSEAAAHADEASFLRALDAGWAAGEASLVLTRVDAVRLHWVLALGVAANGAVGTLDSDGQLRSLPGGPQKLAEACDLTESLGFKTGILQLHGISRYNLIRLTARKPDTVC